MRTRIVVVIDISHAPVFSADRVGHVVESYIDHGTFREGLETAFDGAKVAFSHFDIEVVA